MAQDPRNLPTHTAPRSLPTHDERLRAAFHRLWTKAVGTQGYDKAEWVELETLIANKHDATWQKQEF